MPDLTVIIVSFNTKGDLGTCLRSLHVSPPAVAHEIVVVDNASRDGSIDMVRSQWPGVRLIALDRNVGFGAANNVGLRATAGALVLLLNSDTVVPAGAIDHLVRALRERPDASIVGPRLIDGEGHVELSFGRMNGPFAELRQKTLQRLASPAQRARIASDAHAVDWVSGACLLVKRSAAEAAGLFDERYFMYWEDVDFCAAVRATGARVYFTPQAEIVHYRGRSGAIDPSATGDAYRRSHLAFYRKHHPAWAPFLAAYLALRGKLPRKTADKEGVRG